MNQKKNKVDDLLNQPLINLIHPADRDIFLGRFRAFYHAPEDKSMEIRMICGDHVVCDMLLEGRITDLHPSTHDEKTPLLFTISDITTRKDTQTRLHLASRALENTIEGIVITDQKGTIVDVNRAFERITGYSRNEAIGQNPSLLHSGRQNKAFYQQMWHTLAESGEWQGRIWNKRKNGEIYPEHLSVTGIETGGKVTHYVGVFSDVTDQLSLETQLLQSQKMEAIGTLVGGIAHDFNNMLAGMTGNLFLAKQKAAQMPEVISHLDSIEQLSHRSAEMISRMLSFARKEMVDMHNMSLTSFVQEVLHLSNVTLPENIAFHSHINNDDALIIHGDRTQLQQVIINLLNNARDAVANAPEPAIDLELTTFTPDQHFKQEYPKVNGELFARLSVRDNGCGIAKEHVNQVFEPFFTTKEAGKGTGLGLAMCYGAVQSHDGVIRIDSQMGAGTTCHIYLPLLVDEEQEHVQTSVISEPWVVHGEVILLADDENMVRESCAEVLESMGYTVLQAEDGKQAVSVFEQHQDQIALVILDVVMPYLGGPQLAIRLQQVKPDLPVLFATGYDRESVLDPSMRMEHCEIITKPYLFKELGEMIQRLISGLGSADQENPELSCNATKNNNK